MSLDNELSGVVMSGSEGRSSLRILKGTPLKNPVQSLHASGPAYTFFFYVFHIGEINSIFHVTDS